MRARVLLRSSLFFSIALVGACSLASLDGLTGGGGPGGGGDALPQVDAADAADGGSLADRSVDVEASPGPFCATLAPRPIVCLDFDDDGLESAGLLSGTVALDKTIALSPPASLVTTVETSSSERRAYISPGIPQLPASFELGADVLVDELDDAHDVETITMYFRLSSGECSLGISIRAGQWTFDQSCQGASAPDVGQSTSTSKRAVVGSWTRLELAADLGARTWKLSVKGNPISGKIDPAFEVGPPAFIVGINYLQVAATKGTRLHVDNVWLR